MANSERLQSNEYRLTPQLSTPPSPKPPSMCSFASLETLVAPPAEFDGNQTASGTAGSYRGFRSREKYMEALREWAQSKAYIESEHHLYGWYGNKTIDDYNKIHNLNSNRGFAKSLSRTATVADSVSTVVVEEGETARKVNTTGSMMSNLAKAGDGTNRQQEQGRLKRLSRVFSRGFSET